VTDSYRCISPGELAPADIRRRRCRLGIVRKTAWLFGREELFQRVLRSSLKALSGERCGFAVPSVWSMAACGRRLQFDCATEQIAMHLADWVGCGEKFWHVNDHFLGSGDWVPLLKPSVDTFVAREAEELYACALDYRATETYAVLKQAALDGRPVRRQQLLLDRPEHLDRYFEQFVSLFRSIQDKGMLPCAELPMKGRAALHERDIGVAIGAGGELYRLPGGQHRTAIARVLGLASLPVEVRLVHVGWLHNLIEESGEQPLLALYRGIGHLAPPLH
jgi:hypothetical protein